MQRTRRGCTRALRAELQITGGGGVPPVFLRTSSVDLSSFPTRDPRHSRTAEELWNRTLVTPVDPPARLAAVEYRRKAAPRKAIATSPRTSSSNFTICRARRGRAHHRRAWKRARVSGCSWLSSNGGYWHRAAASLTTPPSRPRSLSPRRRHHCCRCRRCRCWSILSTPGTRKYPRRASSPGLATRRPDPPILAVDRFSRRGAIPAARWPYKALSLARHYPLEDNSPAFDFSSTIYVNTGTPRSKHTSSHSRKQVIVTNTILFLVSFRFFSSRSAAAPSDKSFLRGIYFFLARLFLFVGETRALFITGSDESRGPPSAAT